MILVTGVSGQLGYDVVKELHKRKIECVGISSADFDITDQEATETFIKKVMPEAIIHCAAYTAVDRAEEEIEICKKVNIEGTRNIVQACSTIGAKMVYISTDYVFSGTGTADYNIEDPICPLGVYGKTKLDGEMEVRKQLNRYFIVRISWVFGFNGGNFIKTMLRLGKQQKEVSVVCDQIGSPSYTYDVAKLLCDMVNTEKYGVYHATNEGYCSWAELAEYVFHQAGYTTKVKRIKTKDYPTKATRPNNSRLSKKALDENGFQRLPCWKDAVDRYLLELGEHTNA